MSRLDYWHVEMPYLGARRLRSKLRDEGLIVGRKRIKSLMEEMGIFAIYPKKNLSKRNQKHKIYPYLLRNKHIFLPNQVWAIDITYIKMRHGHMYFTAIIDWCSRYIVGWELSDTLEAAPVLKAVQNAINSHGTPAIINSDQGSQFTGNDYTELLKTSNILQSMDGKARWVDNIRIERWFRSLKHEDIYINAYCSPRELKNGIKKYVQAYNYERPHESLGYACPADIYHGQFVAA